MSVMQYRMSGRERGAESKAWKLFQAVGDVEVVEHAAVGIEVRGSVCAHEEGRDLDDARRIGGMELFPRRAFARLDVHEIHDARPRDEVVDVERAAVGGPSDREVVRGEPGNRARLPGLDGIDGKPPVRPEGGYLLAVGRDGILTEDPDSFGRDGPRLSARDVHREEASAAAGLVAQEETAPAVRKKLRPLAVDPLEREFARLSRARRQELKHCAPEVLRSEGPPAVGR